MSIINRWYEILELLLSRDTLTSKEIEDKLQLTPYTIKNNIELLNNELIGIAHIYEKDKNYHIKIEDFTQLQKIMSGSLKKESDFNSSSKRVAYILKELFLNKGYHIITNFAEELSVSRNTINNDLKAARELLKNYEVSIDSTTGKGIRLTGSVLDKRIVYMNLVQDYFDFEFINEDSVSHLLKILSNYNINEKLINRILKAVDVLIGSIQLGEKLEQPIAYYSNIVEESLVFEEIIYTIESYYELSLSQYERDFVSFPLNLNNTNQYKKTSETSHNYLVDIFNHMVEKIEDSFVIELDRELLYSKISNHLFHLINRSIFDVAPQEIFYGEVEKKYPFSFEIAKVSASSIESDINREIDLIEVNYLTLYFEMVLRDTWDSMNMNVAIISDAGIGATNIIQRQIDSVIGKGTQFTHFSESNYLEAELSEFFVIFTAVPLKNPPKAVPIIRISNILSDQWLSKELEKVIVTNPNLINSTLTDVYTLDHNKDYMTNLLFLIDQLQDEKLVDEEFKQRIIKREEKQLTVFDNGIAFPHEVNPGSERITLNVGIFEEEYIINHEHINMMLLLAVPDNLTESNEQKLMELYDLIFRLSNDHNFKQDISSINNRIDFIEYLENRRLSL